jgi:sodium/potassium-transporting ATPase subunit beta
LAKLIFIRKFRPERFHKIDSRGFPSYYFPYENQEHYESPLVAVQFKNPNPGQLLHIECRAWAKNIDYDRRHRMGISHFELYVLNDAMAENL